MLCSVTICAEIKITVWPGPGPLLTTPTSIRNHALLLPVKFVLSDVQGCFLYSRVGSVISYDECISGPRDNCLCSEDVACVATQDNIVDWSPGVQYVGKTSKMIFIFF